MKKQSKKSVSKKIEGMQMPKMGKPVHQSEHTHHSTYTDEKGKRHHRVEHRTETSYEYPEEPDSIVGHVLKKRGY